MTGPLITLVLPYFNEADFIAETLDSLARQADRRFALVLVDNASTDGSAAIAREGCTAMADIGVTFLHEAQPGKLFALRRGLAEAGTPYVATLDADTLYPPDYVARTLASFVSGQDVVAVMALGMAPAGPDAGFRRQQVFARLMPQKCHTGGYGQAFDRLALEQAGGFDPARWPYVLEDHEIVHRIGKLGRVIYPAGHACVTSDRRSDRSGCSWNAGERLLYKLLPGVLMDWFFYRFLGPQFEQRGLNNLRLREQRWQADQASS